ncbi:MAG: KamA family radical SAM protein [Deltaproteobacteria bacterium]|nr:KamA family radical SAM protein [Deltaproteobacteria bacterium]MBN2844833.1 KamA family radical SAM protein [Deltaproteobacteria bacterium]
MEKQNTCLEDGEPPDGGLVCGALESKPEKEENPVPRRTIRSASGAMIVPKRANVSGFFMSARTAEFRRRFFKDVSPIEWNDWRWQIRHSITTMGELERMLSLSDDERTALKGDGSAFPLAITPYYASLLDPDNPLQPLRRTVIPVTAEKVRNQGEHEDPLGEEADSPVPGVVHRYPDRVLFLVTDFCSTYCRYCTRSRMVGRQTHRNMKADSWNKAIEYIESNPSIRDVLVSGGDPLTLSDERLEWLLSRLHRIPHVEVVRIGTKAPVVLPQRITPALCRMLRKYHPLWMSIHFTHPQELTEEVERACENLANAGIPLQSQTVLLAGINDNVDTMRRLVHGLVKMRVRPYYLYQCDPIIGSGHFRTSVAKGLEITRGLRGYTSGFAIPMYVIDCPGGGGKVPLTPEYAMGRDGDDILLKNYEGNIYRYFDGKTENREHLSCKGSL